MMRKKDKGKVQDLNDNQAVGPLVVSKVNPRYFTVLSGDNTDQSAIYLTGSTIWDNFHDGMGPGADCVEPAEQFDFDQYLNFLKEHGHNFIRLWRWEHFKSQAAGGSFHLCMTPQPWLRTGPGMAKDDKPKFNLEMFDPAYFERLRRRILAAGEAGIYVSVMLFDGFALHLSPAPYHVEGHPFYGHNNVNGIGIHSIVDYQVLPLDPHVQAIQEAYIRKVVDTVHDLPNVLYEVANESSGGGSVDLNFAQMMGLSQIPDWGNSTEWQYWVIDALKQYEQKMGYDHHPVGMTMQFPVKEQMKVNGPLFSSAADWISPGYDDEIFADGGHPMAPGSPPSHWYDTPPANDGRKVILTDTDHYAAGKGDALWAWKSFLRCHHPILMDFGIIAGLTPGKPSPGIPPYEAFEATRYAMGDTLRYAQKMDLIQMEPRNDLSTTGYVLANPGHEYLVLQAEDSAQPFTVNLDAGTYAVEWFGINDRKVTKDASIKHARKGNREFQAAFEPNGPCVLYLKRASS